MKITQQIDNPIIIVLVANFKSFEKLKKLG